MSEQLDSLFVHNIDNKDKKGLNITAKFIVEGLGAIELKNFQFSSPLVRQIEAECRAALEVKLGRTIKT
ncbi:MAG: hypothetical protein GY774_13205 [Planctomycetes bacterium]|nr:hypothetical protein [Planctomycetota bacterium]